MKKIIASVVVAFGLVCGSVNSADAQVRRGPIETRTDVTTTTTGGVVLNEESLIAMLRDLGYEAKTFNVGSGKMYHVSCDKDGFHYEIHISFSPNMRKLWIYNTFAPRSYSMDEMRRLMEASALYGPAHFRILPSGELSLGLAVDNHDLNRDTLRTELDFFMLIVRQTEPLWGGPVR